MATKKRPKKKAPGKKVLKKKVAKKKPVIKKVVKKKVLKKAPAKKKIVTKQRKKANIIGLVTHYFPHVRAAVVKLKAPLKTGDVVKIKGHTTDFIQTINSMQIDRVPIEAAKPGDEIGILVDSRVRQHDVVYKP